jgi:hypothetical protein
MANGFHYVEKLLLPDWRDNECPWCWEFRELDNVARYMQPSERMAARYEHLRDTASGMKGELFLHWSSVAKRHLGLGPQAIFGPANMSEADLFASVASAIQQLRDQKLLHEQYVTPMAKILNSHFYLAGRFYDSIIPAAIFRAARRHDLRASSVEQELIRELSDILANDAAAELRSEILLAIAQGKLPRVASVNEDGKLFGGERGACAFLKMLLS